MRVKLKAGMVATGAQATAFTLMEVVVSLLIIALIFSGVITGYVQTTRKAEWSGYSLAAGAIGLQQLERARSAVWDETINKNEFTNMTLTGWTYNSSTRVGTGYAVAMLDLPYQGGTNKAVYATNYVTVSMLYLNNTTNPPVRLQMVKVDTVWAFYGFKGAKRIYTNTSAAYFAPDNRDASTL